jgi:hypothetical protein
VIDLTRYDEDIFDLTDAFDTSVVTSKLLSSGADKDTISVYARKINSKPGAVGSGYIPKSDSTKYIAGFPVSPNSVCWITIWDNKAKMISILKTIKITEIILTLGSAKGSYRI